MFSRYAIAAFLSTCSALAASDTESWSTVTIESFVTVTVKPTDSTSAPSTHGLGDYIMQGLSDSESDSQTTSKAPLVLPPRATRAPFPTSNATNSTTATGWQACQTSHISWSDAWTSAYRPEVLTLTQSYTYIAETITFNVTFGQADVYTTIDGIPHARGELNATSTSQFVDVYTEASTSTVTTTTTRSTTLTNPRPTCTIEPSKCTALWQSYLGEQGMPTTFDNATEPAITPMPTERPRCAVGNATLSCLPQPKPSCVLSARSVDLFYWPTITAAPNASDAKANISAVNTAVYKNITMTSPSVYLIFDHLQALSSTDLDMKCSKTVPLGATNEIYPVGGAARSLVGGPYTDAVVSLDPISLTSLVRDLGPGINTASVVSEIAHGGSSYSYWVNAVHGTRYNYKGQGGYYSSVLAKPVDYANFEVPDAEAYYMNVNVPPGCNRMGDHPQCSTIFDGAYRAQLLVPEQVRTLRPEWAECYDPLFGAYDPPIALTPAAGIVLPSNPDDSAGKDTTKEAPKEPTPASAIVEPTSGPAPESSPKDSSSGDDTKDQDNQRSGDGLVAVPAPTIPSDPSPTPPPPKDSSNAQPAMKPGENNNESSSNTPNNSADDKPSGDTSKDPAKDSNDNNPVANPPSGSSDKQASNENSSDPPKDSNGNNAAANSPSGSNDKPASNENPNNPAKDLNGSNNNNAAVNPPSGSSDKPASNESPNNQPKDDNTNGNNPSTPNGNSQNAAGDNAGAAVPKESAQGGGSKENSSNSPGASTGSQDSGSGSQDGSKENSNKSPENALDVLSGAQQGNAPKATAATGNANSGGNGQSNSATGDESGNSNGASHQDSNKNDASNKPGSSEKVVVVDGKKHTVAAHNGAPVVDGVTLPADGSPATVNGQTISAVKGGVAIASHTVPLAAGNTAAPKAGPIAVFTVGDRVITASPGSSPGVVVVDGTTMSADDAVLTAHGAKIGAASNGVVVDGTTIPYANAAPRASHAAVTLGSDIATASVVSNGVVAIGDVALTAGAAAATISGHVVSAGSAGLIVDGTTAAYENGGSGASHNVLTFGSDRATASAMSDGVFAFGGVTLTAGGPGTTVSGLSISAASSGLVVDGSTMTIGSDSSDSTRKVLTLGSDLATASMVSSGVFAIGSVTLTAGGSDATISGHTISAAASGLVIDDSSASSDTSSEESTASETDTSEPATSTDASSSQSETSADQQAEESTPASAASKFGVVHWTVLISCGLIFLL